MIEIGGANIDPNDSSSKGHRRNGDFIFKGPTYESNLIAGITSGPVFVLGKGGVRMSDITIKNNIIATNLKDPAIQIASPQKDLKIENNVFYDQTQVIKVVGKGTPMKRPPLPSHILVRNNMFVDNKGLIDTGLFDGLEGSTVVIDHNLFDDNTDAPVGTNSTRTSISFMDPKHFDFRVESDGEETYKAFGPFADEDATALIGKWRQEYQKMPKPLAVDSY
jgi:hypothetical protein